MSTTLVRCHVPADDASDGEERTVVGRFEMARCAQVSVVSVIVTYC